MRRVLHDTAYELMAGEPLVRTLRKDLRYIELLMFCAVVYVIFLFLSTNRHGSL